MYRIYKTRAGSQFAIVAATNINDEVGGYTRKAFRAAYSREFIYVTSLMVLRWCLCLDWGCSGVQASMFRL